MRDWVWRLSFVAVWLVLVVAGLGFFRLFFGHACDDCINSRPGYYGEGGIVGVNWVGVVAMSLLMATLGTWFLLVVSRVFRRRPSDATGTE